MENSTPRVRNGLMDVTSCVNVKTPRKPTTLALTGTIRRCIAATLNV